MFRDECPETFFESMRLEIVVTIEYDNELRNVLEPGEFSLIFSRYAFTDLINGITVINLHDVTCRAGYVDHDVRECIRSVEFNLLLNANELRLDSVLCGVSEATDIASEFLNE